MTFARVLQSKSKDAIIPEAIQRLESGRRRYAAETEMSTAAELELLAKERQRLEEESGADDPRLARIARLAGAVEADLGATRTLRAEMDQTVSPLPGGWTVLGRVLTRDGRVPARGEVAFVGDDGQEITALGRLPVDTTGAVRQAYPREIAQDLEQRNVAIAAVARVGGRVAATDQRVLVRSGQLYQFDLRVDAAS